MQVTETVLMGKCPHGSTRTNGKRKYRTDYRPYPYELRSEVEAAGNDDCPGNRVRLSFRELRAQNALKRQQFHVAPAV